MTMETEQIVEQSPKATPRNFRTAIDIENFYRFINENDLRREAKIMLEQISMKVLGTAKKKRKESKSKKNLH